MGKFRFSSSGLEFSGNGADLFAGAVRARFRLSEQGQAIVDALKAVLSAAVVLHDNESRMHHVATRGSCWFSLQTTAEDEPQLCYVEARINRRWTLYGCSRRPLHPDAESIVKWAAAKLALHVPNETADEPMVPPSRGGGGSGGGAELGIPVWWARKINTN